MKTFTGLLGFFLLICYLQELSLAAPSHVKRDEEYRNALFDAYGCRVLKAADVLRNKLNVSLDNIASYLHIACITLTIFV